MKYGKILRKARFFMIVSLIIMNCIVIFVTLPKTLVDIAEEKFLVILW